MTLTLNDRARAAAHLLSVTMDGETMILDTDRGVYLSLNDTASAMLSRLQDEKALRDLCAELTEAFNGDPAEIERDVLAFAGELTAAKLISIA